MEVEPRSLRSKDSLMQDHHSLQPVEEESKSPLQEAASTSEISNLSNLSEEQPPLIEIENYHDKLIKKHEALKRDLKVETEKNAMLNNLLFKNLSSKGVSCQVDARDTSAADSYCLVLENLFKIHRHNQLLEENINRRRNEKMKIMQMNVDEMEREQNELVELVTATLTSNQHAQPMPEKVAMREVNKLFTAYEAMSSIRLDFLRTQNAIAELMEKEAELSDLGEGLKTIDYENLTTDVQNVTSRIDLQQEQMDRLWGRFKRDQKTLKSIKTELRQIFATLANEKKQYKSLREDEISLLNSINEMQEKKKVLKEEVNELSLQAGILSRAPLMRHYDSVNKEIEKITNEISVFQELHDKFSVKFSKLELKVKKSKANVTFGRETIGYVRDFGPVAMRDTFGPVRTFKGAFPLRDTFGPVKMMMVEGSSFMLPESPSKLGKLSWSSASGSTQVPAKTTPRRAASAPVNRISTSKSHKK